MASLSYSGVRGQTQYTECRTGAPEQEAWEILWEGRANDSMGPAALFPCNHGSGRKRCFKLRDAGATSGECFPLSHNPRPCCLDTSFDLRLRTPCQALGTTWWCQRDTSPRPELLLPQGDGTLNRWMTHPDCGFISISTHHSKFNLVYSSLCLVLQDRACHCENLLVFVDGRWMHF